MESTYRIGALAARTALSRDTLRYYERRGLLDRPQRTSGGFRVYDEATLERLQFLKRAQAVGFSLEEIRELVTFNGRGSVRCRRVRDLIQAKLADLDQRLLDLRAFRGTLRHALRDCNAVLSQEGDAACPVVERGAPRQRGLRPGALKRKGAR